MAKRSERTEETRARVVSAARSLFREHGFSATRVDQIASRAGVAKGTVFLHAGSKERLLLMVYGADLAYAAERALAAVDLNAPLPRALGGLFSVFFRLYEEDVELARQFVKEQASLHTRDHQLRGITTRLLVGLEVVIQVRQRRGEVAADVDVPQAARTTFAVYHAVLLEWLGGWLPDPAARDAELSASLALLWRGLLTEPA
jgi:TetR/AcrR family transcriptional regulator, cholesterol catabolism regulator